MKVLIVDDNENITEVVKDFFELGNIECKTINNGVEGLAEIQNSNYDLILLDIAIPDYSGLDILDELKNKSIKSKNIVLFTASLFNPEDIEKYSSIGVKEICEKPVSLEKLENIKQKYLFAQN
ncbi:response regulator [Candidatus Nitrosocosmicus franklandus]|uniref:Response regulator n=1 Tax=Candidatus Nitrosocosmicus franklandianus TaxID=1798806 RepID=A0A484I4E8_9ARCH|nr:response regulator [Candidatus Nitrosocosmicus franklandus]VFJ12535.1 Response regulator [Candidatus Nitrosocosmicus franklandus]